MLTELSREIQAWLAWGFFGMVAVLMVVPWLGVYWYFHHTWPVRRSPEGRPRLCERCKYDVTGLVGEKCPECGHSPGDVAPADNAWRSILKICFVAVLPFATAAVVAFVWPQWHIGWTAMWRGNFHAENWIVLVAVLATQVQLGSIVFVCRRRQVAGFGWWVAGALLVATILEMVLTLGLLITVMMGG